MHVYTVPTRMRVCVLTFTNHDLLCKSSSKITIKINITKTTNNNVVLHLLNTLVVELNKGIGLNTLWVHLWCDIIYLIIHNQGMVNILNKQNGVLIISSSDRYTSENRFIWSFLTIVRLIIENVVLKIIPLRVPIIGTLLFFAYVSIIIKSSAIYPITVDMYIEWKLNYYAEMSLCQHLYCKCI